MGKDEHYDNRRKNKAHSGAHSAWQPCNLGSDKGGCINANRSRSHLRNSKNIDKLLHGQPTMLINNLGLNEGHGGVATAHAEGADLHEAPKKLPINHPTHKSATSLRIFFISQ